jgi:alpha-D-xyloside xylohydrolase
MATRYDMLPDALLLRSSQRSLRLRPISDRTIRVTLAQGAFADDGTLSVRAQAVSGRAPAWDLRETDSALELSTALIAARVSRETEAIAWTTPLGLPVARMGRAELRKTREAFEGTLPFEWSPSEALYGLGQHPDGIGNLRRTVQHLYQSADKVALPCLLSTAGYGVFLDAGSLVTFRDDQYGSELWAGAIGQLDFYFIFGPDFHDIICELRNLLGGAPMIPRWLLGYQHGLADCEAPIELTSIAREFRQRQFPLDSLALRSGYAPMDQAGQKSFDPRRFPDPDALTGGLLRAHIRLMLGLPTTMRGDSPDHRDLEKVEGLLPDDATLDPFNAKARAVYWRQTSRGLRNLGVSGWWLPEQAPPGARLEHPQPWQRLTADLAEIHALLPAEFCNAAPMPLADAIYQLQRRQDRHKRVVQMVSSAFVGQHRYSCLLNTGGIRAGWQAMRDGLAGGLQVCATGLPYWTMDIGGASCEGFRDGCDDVEYRELFLRWFQLGTFLPVMRAYGQDSAREPWRFGEVAGAILAEFAALRYRLLPYLYALAWRVTSQHDSFVRQLAYDFREDPGTHEIFDQFMLGPSLMICPVLRPGAAARRVYLPAGCDWYDFWTHRRLSGGHYISAEAPLSQIPVYVRAGSILPLAQAAQHTDEERDSPLEIRIYRGADGAFIWYEDEGEGYQYEDGIYTVAEFSWNNERPGLFVSERQGHYPGMPERRELRIVLPDEGLDPVEVVSYDGSEFSCRLWLHTF